jgi:hypothetical protein
MGSFFASFSGVLMEVNYMFFKIVGIYATCVTIHKFLVIGIPKFAEAIQNAIDEEEAEKRKKDITRTSNKAPRKEPSMEIRAVRTKIGF